MADARALSHAEKALWFLYKLAPGSAAYHTGAALVVHAGLDLAALARAVDRLAEQHEMLRSTYTEADGVPVRIVHPVAPVRLEVRETAAAGPAELRELARTAVNEPFGLEQDGPFRFAVLRGAGEEVLLLMAGHHIATDAFSNSVLMRDLFTLYEQAAAGKPLELPPVRSRYDAFVAAEEELLASPRRSELERHWAEIRQGAAAAELPLDRPRSAASAQAGATYRVELTDAQVEAVRAAAQEAGVTLFAYLLGAFQGLVHRYTRRGTFLIGCPTTARTGSRMRGVVGNFVNTLVFRAAFTRTTTFREAVLAASEQVRAGMGAVAYPFALVARSAAQAGADAGAPLCRITFNLIGTAHPDPLLQLLLDPRDDAPAADWAGLRISPVELPQSEGQLDLAVHVQQSRRSLGFEFRYDTSVFEPDTIRRLAHQFVRLLDAAAADPDGPVSRAALLRESELAALAADAPAAAPAR
ncbi:condensation domain-containing protein [Kitasatospora sp. NPDC054939]